MELIDIVNKRASEKEESPKPVQKPQKIKKSGAKPAPSSFSVNETLLLLLCFMTFFILVLLSILVGAVVQ